METKQIEMKSYRTVYVAVDGTEFENETECIKYDKSAMGVIKGRVKKLAAKVTDEWAALGGDPDHECWIVIPKTPEDVSAIRQLLVLYGNNKPSDDLEEQNGKVVYLMWNFDGDYMWFKTLESILKFASE